ncbi:RDH54 [Candida pseudojiufengensis]|uniref:RDH54 n=1 Tax=Candida pseudojiufengensis TaxID=497109 RepID=UPI002224EFA1|nr:RDH54 [Candida pseudojiufengensis]KAI5960080.1 RDH54 [Candida pseudojiufengensis]
MFSKPNAPFKPPRLIRKDEPSEVSRPVAKSLPTSNKSSLLKRQRVPTINNTITKKIKPEENLDTTKSEKYIVQWRRKTNKKNKSWDGDGQAIIKYLESGCEITLKSSDGKPMSKKKFIQLPNFNDVIAISVYEIMLDEKVDDEFPKEDSIIEIEPSPPPQIITTEFKKVVPENYVEQTQSRNPLYKDTSTISLTPPPNSTNYVDINIDPLLSNILRPHQIEGVKFLYECLMGYRDFKGNGCLLADEMGLGKTLMTITTIWTLLKQNPDPIKKSPIVNKILIVCPVTLINNWGQEFKKWLGPNKINVLTLNNPKCDDKREIINFGKLNVYQVLIINYEKILSHIDELSTVNFNLLVCDEGHRLKNNSAKVLINLKKLNISKKIILTGTPIQNDLEEFHTIVSFINPDVLPTFKTFQKEFINPITRARDINCFNLSIKTIGEQKSKELIELTHKFILRRTQSILENYLTNKTDILLFVPPTNLQLKLFAEIKDSNKFNLETGSNSLALINVFRKICNSPSLLATDEYYKSICSEPIKLSTSSGKLNALIPLILEIVKHNEKIVLISNYTKTLDFLELVINKLNLKHLRLDGSTSNNLRNKLVNQFNKDESINIFLLSSKSGGMGINLIGASRLILYDNDWNPSTDLQSMSRIHRDGQLKPCFIYRIFTTGCIDEKIFQRQLMKNKLSSKFLDNDVSSTSDVFDYNDLKNLFTINENTKSNTHDLLECSCCGDGSVILTQEDESESEGEDLFETRNSFLSASDLQKRMDEEGAKVKAVKKALSDYAHYDPETTTDLQFDPVLSKIVKNISYEQKLPFTYIMQKSRKNQP